MNALVYKKNLRPSVNEMFSYKNWFMCSEMAFLLRAPFLLTSFEVGKRTDLSTVSLRLYILWVILRMEKSSFYSKTFRFSSYLDPNKISKLSGSCKILGLQPSLKSLNISYEYSPSSKVIKRSALVYLEFN